MHYTHINSHPNTQFLVLGSVLISHSRVYLLSKCKLMLTAYSVDHMFSLYFDYLYF